MHFKDVTYALLSMTSLKPTICPYPMTAIFRSSSYFLMGLIDMLFLLTLTDFFLDDMNFCVAMLASGLVSTTEKGEFFSFLRT